MANFLQMLAEMLSGQGGVAPVAAGPVNRLTNLGGMDTPAGGGALDAVGQRIMQQQLNPYMGGAAPVNAQPAPSAAPVVDNVQTASTPSPAPSGGGIGGFVQNLFSGGQPKMNATVNWLQTKGYDAGTSQFIAGNKDILQKVLMTQAMGGQPNEYMERAKAASQFGVDPSSEAGRSFILTGKLDAGGDEYNRRATAALRYGLKQGTPEFENFVLSGDLPDARGGAAEVGLQPQYGVDADGNPVLIQLGKDGKGRQTEMPPGVKLSKEPIKIDAGTNWVLLDPITRQPISTIPKDLAGAEADKAAGKARGEAAFDLPRVEQNANQTLAVLERMKSHPGRAGSTGFLQGALPSRTPDQVDFQSLVDQTQGQSFLQAFQMLKGAGQITEIEGTKATNAISRLGNQRLSDDEYLKAINDLEEVINTGLERARKQAGSPSSSSKPITEMSDDELKAIINGN